MLITFVQWQLLNKMKMFTVCVRVSAVSDFRPHGL